MLAAIAGILDFSFIQTVQPNIGLSFTFPVFAAVIIGGASLTGGKGTIIGTHGGALLLAELQQGLALLCPGPHVQQTLPRRRNDRRGGPRPVPDRSTRRAA